MGSYGFLIVKALVTDLSPAAQVPLPPHVAYRKHSKLLTSNVAPNDEGDRWCKR